MNIVFTIADLIPERGGPSRTVPALCSALASEGASVELVTMDSGGKDCRTLAPPGPVRTEFVQCAGPISRQLRWTPQFNARLQARCGVTRETILHDTGLWLPTNHAAASVARKLRLPFIVSPRGMLTQGAIQYRGWKKKFAWRLYQRRDLECAQVLHATSREEVDGFRNAGLCQPIALVPNGVELPPPPNSKLPTSNSDHRTILFLSRIHPVKGLLNLVEAWAAVRPEGWRVVVAGENDSGHQRDVEKAIRQHQLEKDFDFPGPVDGERKWDLYRSADLFVLPSHTENFGLVVAEALACGLPVITTKGAPWEQLVTHKCGWWVEIGAEHLARALAEAVMATDAERQETGCRGRELVESKFTWKPIAQRMIAVYEWMMGGAAKPECVV